MAPMVATNLTIETQGLGTVHDSAGSGESSPSHSPNSKGVRKVASFHALHTVEENKADTQADNNEVLSKLNDLNVPPRKELGRSSVSFNTTSAQLNLNSLFRVSKYPGSSPASTTPSQAVDPIVQQLGRACYSLEVDVVDRMLQAGVDHSSAVDADGNLAIHYAAIAVECDDVNNIGFSNASSSSSKHRGRGWLCCGNPVTDEKQRQWQGQSKVAQVSSDLWLC
jgi:hypothetical protein